MDGGMDGGMDCKFTSFPTVFQTYQDDERITMTGCGTAFTVVQSSPSSGARTRADRLVGQRLT